MKIEVLTIACIGYIVVVGRALAPYDLLWPVSKTVDAGMPDVKAKVVEDVQTRKNHLSMSSGMLFFCSVPLSHPS